MAFTEKDWVTEEWIFGTALKSQDGNHDHLKNQIQLWHDHGGRPPGNSTGLQVHEATEIIRGAEYRGQTSQGFGTCGSPPCTSSSLMDLATMEDTSLIIPYWVFSSATNSWRGTQGIGKKVGSGETNAYHGTIEWISPPAAATVEHVKNYSGGTSGGCAMNLSNEDSFIYS